MHPNDRRELEAMHKIVQRRLSQAQPELALCVALLIAGLMVELVVGLTGGMLMFIGGLVMLIGGVDDVQPKT